MFANPSVKTSKPHYKFHYSGTRNIMRIGEISLKMFCYHNTTPLTIKRIKYVKKLIQDSDMSGPLFHPRISGWTKR